LQGSASRDAQGWCAHSSGHGVFAGPGEEDIRPGSHAGEGCGTVPVAGAGSLLLRLRRRDAHGEGCRVGAAGCDCQGIELHTGACQRISGGNEEAEAVSAGRLLETVAANGKGRSLDMEETGPYFLSN